MACWSCIDGTENWEYSSLGIAEEVRKIADVDAWMPRASIDETSLTAVLSAWRTRSLEPEELATSEAVAARRMPALATP